LIATSPSCLIALPQRCTSVSPPFTWRMAYIGNRRTTEQNSAQLQQESPNGLGDRTDLEHVGKHSSALVADSVASEVEAREPPIHTQRFGDGCDAHIPYVVASQLELDEPLRERSTIGCSWAWPGDSLTPTRQSPCCRSHGGYPPSTSSTKRCVQPRQRQACRSCSTACTTYCAGKARQGIRARQQASVALTLVRRMRTYVRSLTHSRA
jgi:hypothetical protein